MIHAELKGGPCHGEVWDREDAPPALYVDLPRNESRTCAGYVPRATVRPPVGIYRRTDQPGWATVYEWAGEIVDGR